MGIENDLKHFGIKKDSLGSVRLSRCKNDDFFREKTGVNLAIRGCALRKARIIIDYDADFPSIITRVIPQ